MSCHCLNRNLYTPKYLSWSSRGRDLGWDLTGARFGCWLEIKVFRSGALRYVRDTDFNLVRYPSCFPSYTRERLIKDEVITPNTFSDAFVDEIVERVYNRVCEKFKFKE